VTLPTLSSLEIIARLESVRAPGPAAITFDGDGTLWSGDVAEDVFCHAVDNELLRVEPAEALARAASQFGVPVRGSPSRIARDIFDAYLAGRYPEREVCEVMTWCFAGFSLAELVELTRDVLTDKRLERRLTHELSPVFDWARLSGVRRLVISASPRPIVEVAAKLWGIEPSAIAASTPALESGRILPRLAHPVPYAEAKVECGRELIGDAHWLGAFGDSGFDAHMLRAAAVAVAVRPKPSLRGQAAGIPGLVALESEGLTSV
jgi:phosphoserine phosphatase